MAFAFISATSDVDCYITPTQWENEQAQKGLQLFLNFIYCVVGAIIAIPGVLPICINLYLPSPIPTTINFY